MKFKKGAANILRNLTKTSIKKLDENPGVMGMRERRYSPAPGVRADAGITEMMQRLNTGNLSDEKLDFQQYLLGNKQNQVTPKPLRGGKLSQ